MLLGEKFEDCLKEISFADQKIKDYFSPQGTFPDGMYMAEELRDKTYQVPKGYTEEDCIALLMAVTCSDVCMEDTLVSASSAPDYMVDPRKNGIVKQISMMMSNSICMDDFVRQKGISQAYGKGRDIMPELLNQLTQNDLTGSRKLVSEGIKNIILTQKNQSRVLEAEKEGYSSNRVMEIVVDFLEQHPDLRDPEILNDQDMEEIQFFRGRMAYLKEAQEKGKEYLEKLKTGKELTEDDIAEVVLLNQIYATSNKENTDRKSAINAEFLKQEKLPGGISMPIGQVLSDIQGGLRSYDLNGDSLSKFMGPGERKRYIKDLSTRANETAISQGYGDFTRAVAMKYPENREFLLDQVKKSAYFQEMITKKGKNLINALTTMEPKEVFTKETTEKLLEMEGLQANPITYHAETIPENREYAEALEAEKRGEDIHTDKWEKRFQKMAEVASSKEEENRKTNEVARKYDTLSFRLGERLRVSKENWCKGLVKSEDALTDLLTNGSCSVFVLNPSGDMEYLEPNPDGSDLEEVKKKCLEAETNGIFIKAPAGVNTKNEIMAIRLDMEVPENECQVTPIQDYIRDIKDEPLPEKPSLWKRIFAFLVPSYREEIEMYNTAVRDHENAERLETVEKLVHKERTEQNAENANGLNENKEIKKEKYEEKVIDLEGTMDEKLDKWDDAFENENEKITKTLDPDKVCENLQKWIKEETGDTVDKETAILAFINSMKPSDDDMEKYQNRHYTEQVLTGNKRLFEQDREALKWGYFELRDNKKENKRLLSTDKLKCFQNNMMYPDTAVTAFGVGASLLNTLGEEKIKEALMIDKSKKLPSETMGIMEYAKLYQKSSKICDREAEIAKTEPNKALNTEDVLTVLITDSIDRERAVNREVNSGKSGLLTTSLIRHLGKTGMENFKEEVRNSLGDDYLKEQAAMGSKKFVETHRSTLGLVDGKNLNKRVEAMTAQKQMSKQQNKGMAK